MERTDSRVDFRAMLDSAAEQILLQPIRWDPVLAGLLTRLKVGGATTAVRIVPIATTADQLIYTALRQQNLLISTPNITPNNDDSRRTTSNGIPTAPSRDKIAIVGMAGRFPEASSTDALWDILRAGLNVSKEVPPMRWNTKTHVDPSGRKKNSSKVSLGCWLNDPDVFDADFFNIPSHDATRMDPAQRLALMTTYEAIEQAGIVLPSCLNGSDAAPSPRPDRVGVYYGVSGNDWRDCNAAQKVDSHFMRGSNRAFVSAVITETFKLSGPSVTVETSSCNSLAPVHIACRSLRAEETDMCIVGGAQVMTNPDVHAGLDRAGLLSRSGNCKVFDETVDGVCRGEAVVSLVLKRLEDARADDDTVLGVIAGEASTYSSGCPARSETADGTIQKILFTEVLNASNVDPASITYVEMNGPSTKVEDASRVASAVDILAPISTSEFTSKRRTTPLYLGSTMANVGRCEATSGLSSIIKILLMFRERIVPPHIGITSQVNSNLPAELATRRNTHIHTGKAIEWETCPDAASRRDRQRALVYDRGTIAPATSVILLEESPPQEQNRPESLAAADRPLDTDPSIPHLVAISAKSRTSLRRSIANLYLWLMNKAAENGFTLAQLSYTTTARRSHYLHRTMLVASSVEELCAGLHAELQQLRVEMESAPTEEQASKAANTDRPLMTRPIVFAFTSCSTCDFTLSSSWGFFRFLYQRFSRVREDMRDMEQILRRLGLPSVMNALGLENYSGPCQQIQGQRSDETTTQLQMAQELAHLCVQMVLCKLWRSWGISPVAIVTEGGVGVYSALNAAGVLSDADAVYLAGASVRLGLLQAETQGGTNPGGGPNAAATAEFQRLDSLMAHKKAQIPVFGLVPARAGDETQHHGIETSTPRLEVLAGVGEGDRILLTRQCLLDRKSRDSKRKAAGVLTTQDLIEACRISNDIPNQSIIHEIGSGAPIPYDTTADEANTIFGGGGCARIRSEGGDACQPESEAQTWSQLTNALRKFYYAGAKIRWDQYHRDLPRSGRKVISTLPAYSWDLKEYWVPYIDDWTLLKGDAPKAIVATNLESTTIHSIVEETELGEEGSNKLRLVVESDISRKDLHGIVQGHVVDGVPLCTPVRDL